MAGRPSKFTADRKAKILQALQVGASRRTAAAIGGVDEATLRTWLSRAKTERVGSAWAKFAEEVEEAEAHPKARALGIIYNAMEDRPELAWKFIERREHGFAPPAPMAPAAAVGPTVIHLSFATSGPQLVENEIIEGEVEDEQHSLPDAASSD